VEQAVPEDGNELARDVGIRVGAEHVMSLEELARDDAVEEATNVEAHDESGHDHAAVPAGSRLPTRVVPHVRPRTRSRVVGRRWSAIGGSGDGEGDSAQRVLVAGWESEN